MSPGIVALVAAVLLGGVLSLAKSRYDGRFRAAGRAARTQGTGRDLTQVNATGASTTGASAPSGSVTGASGTGARTTGADATRTDVAGTESAATDPAYQEPVETAGTGGGQSMQDAAPEPDGRLTSADLGASLGERATLLQFSSAFCTPCRATRRILAEVADLVDGVNHIELDAESHLDLVRRLGILRTPTVLVLDSSGVIVSRASGQPRKANVIAALGVTVDRPQLSES